MIPWLGIVRFNNLSLIYGFRSLITTSYSLIVWIRHHQLFSNLRGLCNGSSYLPFEESLCRFTVGSLPWQGICVWYILLGSSIQSYFFYSHLASKVYSVSIYDWMSFIYKCGRFSLSALTIQLFLELLMYCLRNFWVHWNEINLFCLKCNTVLVVFWNVND